MDTRIARTRRQLQTALLELARERPLEAITVGEIVDRAGVNRSSFYQHYSDKETLLADAIDAAVEEVSGDLSSLEGPIDGPPAELIAYLQHIEQNAGLYRRLLGDTGSAIVTARVRARIESLVVTGIAKSGVSAFDDLPLDIVAAGIAGSALGVVRAWLDRDPLPSVPTAADWLWRVLLGPGDSWR